MVFLYPSNFTTVELADMLCLASQDVNSIRYDGYDKVWSIRISGQS
jgi:hypothetical protein